MAAGDYVVKNAVFNVGIGSYTYSNVKVRKVTLTPVGEIRPIPGEQGETLSKVITNPGKKIRLEGAVLTGSAMTAVVALKKGDAITINSVAYMVEDKSIDLVAAQETMVSIDAIKEDSMAYT